MGFGDPTPTKSKSTCSLYRSSSNEKQIHRFTLPMVEKSKVIDLSVLSSRLYLEPQNWLSRLPIVCIYLPISSLASKQDFSLSQSQSSSWDNYFNSICT